jgi:CRP-like cAMP-binding protein
MKNTKILMKSFLFSGLDEELIVAILKQSPPTVSSYKRGEMIYSSLSEAPMVGFILSGRCEIRLARDSGNKTVLNILSEGDSFGVLSVYSPDEFPTQIFATKNSDILFFTAEQIREFVNNYSQISANLINFLANRIVFLNKKIATFSGCRVENRLAAFLLSESERQGCLEFAFNCNKTAEEINAGRASVYRAIDSLVADGLVSFVDKKIYINDREGLERISK